MSNIYNTQIFERNFYYLGFRKINKKQTGEN